MSNPFVIVLLVVTVACAEVAVSLYSYANAIINNNGGFGSANPALRYSYAATTWLEFSGFALVVMLLTAGLKWDARAAQRAIDEESKS
jgi:hypothetical protein